MEKRLKNIYSVIFGMSQNPGELGILAPIAVVMLPEAFAFEICCELFILFNKSSCIDKLYVFNKKRKKLI